MDDWRARVTEELEAIAGRVGAETTRMWETGELGADSVRARVTPDFHGTQYAPWFENGAFTASAEQWLDGTADAARQYKAKGIRWTIDHICVLPRSEDEAAVMYRVNHEWGDDRPPARALFLETWVRRDGEWHLSRHTSEKA